MVYWVQMTDFASSALYNLVVSQLEQQNFYADRLRKFSGKTDAVSKRDLLHDALNALGPRAIASIGQGLRPVHFEPTLEVLRRAVDPNDLINRWLRLERYYHGSHRVRVLSHQAYQIQVEHYAVKGASPSPAEDLFIAGLLSALLQIAGCQNLSLYVDGIDRAVITCDRFQNCMINDEASGLSVWTITWEHFERQAPIMRITDTRQSYAVMAANLMRADLGRRWKVSAVARHLGVSVRSLQRHLSGEGDTFQKVLRRARTDHASQALLENKKSLAEIGYMCGFSDQSHFTREFTARFNMTPQDYAKLA